MKFEKDGFLYFEDQERRHMPFNNIGAHNVQTEGKCLIADYAEMIRPKIGAPFIVLADALKNNVTGAAEPLYMGSKKYDGLRIPGAVYLHLCSPLMGLQYRDLYIIAEKTGILHEQLGLEPGAPTIMEKNLKQSTGETNKLATIRQDAHEWVNIFKNYSLIKKLMQQPEKHNIKVSADTNGRPLLDKGPAIIVASGSGLDAALPHLKDFSGPIFCTMSHTSTLYYNGCSNVHSLALDANSQKSSLDECMIDNSIYSETGFYSKNTLITHPGVNPDLLAAWEGRKLLFRPIDPKSEVYQVMARAYPEIELQCLMFMSSASTLVGLAAAMGHNPLYLVGVDFSADRFTRTYYNHAAQEWQTDKGAEPDEVILSNNGKRTTILQVRYMRSFLMGALKDAQFTGVEIVNCSPDSTLEFFPYVDIKKVIKQRPDKKPKYRGAPVGVLSERIEKYLAGHGIYAIRVGETMDPPRLLTYYIEVQGGMPDAIGWMTNNQKTWGINLPRMMQHISWLHGSAERSPYIEEMKG